MTHTPRQRTLRFTLSAFSILILCAVAPADKKEPELDVPFEPTPPQVIEEMLKLGNVTASDYVFDLGCGDGRIVVMAAQKYGCKGFGVDLDPQRIEECKENATANKVTDKVTFKLGDIFDVDLRPATIMATYLLDETNLKLRPKYFRELQPGVRIVSHGFDMLDWKADKEVKITKARNDVIYLWIIPAGVGGTWEWTAKTKSGETPMSLALTQEFQVVQGVLTARGGKPNRLQDVSLSGRDLSFNAQAPDGQRLARVAFKGKVDGDTIKGTQEWTGGSQPGAREWVAKRKPFDLVGAWRIKMQNCPDPLDGVLRIERNKDGMLAAKYVADKDKKESALWHFYALGTSVYFETPGPDEDTRGPIFIGALEGEGGSGRARKEGWNTEAVWTADKEK